MKKLFYNGIIGAALISFGWTLTSCRGVPRPEEKAARRNVSEVSARLERDRSNLAALPLHNGATLSNYLAFAFVNQPQVQAAYQTWSASVERITQERSLPDPRLTFQADIQDIVVSLMPGLMQEFPGPGKLKARAAVAAAESDMQYFRFETAVLQTAFNLKKAYYRLYFIDEKVRITAEMLGLLSELERLARAQNETGKATLHDVLRAQIEEERLATEAASLQDSKQVLVAEFKGALGLRADQPDPPLPIQFETTPLDLSEDQLLASALRHNPKLKQMDAEVRQAQASLKLAYKARVPDFDIGLMADLKMSPLLYRPQGTMTLPIWRDKIAAQIAEAQATRQSAAARLSGEEISLAVDFAEASFDYRESERNLQLLRERLLPKAGQSLEIARSAYAAGQTDFFNLIDAQRTLLGFQMEEIQARTQRELALATISLLILGRFPETAPVLSSAAGLNPNSKP